MAIPAHHFRWKFQGMLATNTGHNLPSCFAVYISGGWDVHCTEEHVEAVVYLYQLHTASFGLLMGKARKLPSHGKVKIFSLWRARILPAGNFSGILENSKHTVR